MNTEIAEYIKNHIREYLPPEYQEAHITLEEVTKGNDRRLTGLMIRNDGEITVPTIYLEPYAKQLAQGRPMDEIIREIVQIRTEQDTRVPFEVRCYGYVILCSERQMERRKDRQPGR